MKVCEIKDEYRNILLGYLFFFEKENEYSIELDDKVSLSDEPIMFHSFVKRGKYTIDPEWSRRWVEARVVPPDRQNLGMILKDAGLKIYDVFRLLLLAEGRCAQDDCAVKPVKYENLPGWVLERRGRKLEFAVRLASWDMILVFRDGMVYRTDLSTVLGSSDRRMSMLRNPAVKDEYRVMAGGIGLMIGGSAVISAEELYGCGIKLPLNSGELRTLAESYVMDTKDVCNELSCSRQYVDQLTKKSGLSVLKDGGTRLYARGDINKVTE